LKSAQNLEAAIAELKGNFGGELLRPVDAGYDAARKVHNGLIDKHPAVIARCTGTAGIVDAVKFGRQHGLEIAVRGGGHNVAGRSTIEGGLMIDLAPMKGIHVDAKARTVRVQGGVNWGEFNRETQLHGLATTGGAISTTGVAGLTLGGGLGWLMGKYGLTADNLISAEVVTADGSVLTASAAENPDLFWALRGGGGNFGVVSSFEFRLHSVGPMITGGLVVHPFEKAGEMLRYYRQLTASLPDEMVVFAALGHAPDGSGTSIAALVVAHCGSLAEGEAAVKTIRSFGPPVMDALGPMPYSAINAMLDAGNPQGALNYWKANFVPELSDGAIDTVVKAFAACTSPMSSILFEHLHGAACRVAVADTAFPHRAAGYNMLCLGQWLEASDSQRNIGWVRDTYAAMKPYMSSGRYVNYMNEDELTEGAASAYGPNHARLREIKRKYDPENVFHLNQNISPA
jgi:FAD/FMN-containing dehydrogenase